MVGSCSAMKDFPSLSSTTGASGVPCHDDAASPIPSVLLLLLLLLLLAAARSSVQSALFRANFEFDTTRGLLNLRETEKKIWMKKSLCSAPRNDNNKRETEVQAR